VWIGAAHRVWGDAMRGVALRLLVAVAVAIVLFDPQIALA
jgi:hypothetical protein